MTEEIITDDDEDATVFIPLLLLFVVVVSRREIFRGALLFPVLQPYGDKSTVLLLPGSSPSHFLGIVGGFSVSLLTGRLLLGSIIWRY